MLGWIQHHFRGMPIVYILRHPCAVAASFVREGWEGQLQGMLAQGSLADDHLSDEQLDAIFKADTLFERAIAIWCIETTVALRQLRLGSHVVCYEHLLSKPKSTLRELWTFLGRDPTDIGGAMKQLRRPSTTSRNGQANDWRTQLSPLQLQRAAAILKAFNLDQLYSVDSPMPNTRIPLQPWLPVEPKVMRLGESQ